MKIDIILTGGTIGTIVQKHDALLDNSLIYKKLTNNSKHNFTFHNPYNIHSEDLVVDHWKMLFNEIEKINDSDGIIVMYGTDTLAYTAAFLSLAFGKSNIPIILVSAHSPLDNSTSNGKNNFEMAVCAIENNVKGVFVSYRNYDSSNTLYLANKLMGFAPYSNKLIATKEPHAKIIDNEFVLCGDDFFEENLPKISFPVNKVTFIPAVPFTDFSIYLNADKQPNYYLVELYHSTSCCTNKKDTRYSFSYFVDKCNQKGIKVYVAPYENREYFYPSKMHFQKTFPLYGDTVIVAYVRLMFHKE